MIVQPLSEEELNSIYNWVDQIPLSRPKRNIARDFSDGVLMAEILYYFLPKIVDIHNYSGANSVKQKKYNWDTLNQKVFRRIGFQLTRQQIDSIIACQPEAIERALAFVQSKIEIAQENQGQNSPNEHGQVKSNYNNNNNNNNDQSYNKEMSTFNQNNFQNNNIHNNELWQKDQIIEELRETIEVLEVKLNQMDEQLKQKDLKIQRYQQLLQQNSQL